jgi:peptidoglycan hydrolase-like protein with peptidoglycan-binding domain
VKRGQSFYAGDGLNKALVSPQAIEALLDKVKGVKPATNPVARPGEANLYATKAMIQIVQARLTELGYPLGSRNSKTGEFDGVVGTLTAAAIRAFRADNGLPEGEYIDADLVAALDTAKPRKLAPARENAPVEKVAEAAPEVAANWRTEVASKYGTVGLLVIAIVDWISGLFSAGQDAIQPMLTILNGFPSWVWLLLAAGVVGVLWWNHRRGRQAGVEAFRTGARL